MSQYHERLCTGFAMIGLSAIVAVFGTYMWMTNLSVPALSLPVFWLCAVALCMVGLRVLHRAKKRDKEITLSRDVNGSYRCDPSQQPIECSCGSPIDRSDISVTISGVPECEPIKVSRGGTHTVGQEMVRRLKRFSKDRPT